MRGRVLHNCLAEDVKAVCDRKRIRSVMEYAVCSPSTTAYFDVAAWPAKRFVAIEIETTVRHIDRTLAKAQMAGVELWVVVPTRKLRGQIKNKLRRLGIRAKNGHFKLFLQSQVEQEFTNYLSLSTPANR
jgi:hypothetical protein